MAIDFAYILLKFLYIADKRTDFVIYNPFQSNPIHIVRILPDEAVFAEMEKRIRVADDIVKELIEAE